MKIFRRFCSLVRLAGQGRFFTLVRETVSTLIPSKYAALCQNVFFRLDRDGHRKPTPLPGLEVRRARVAELSDLVDDLYRGDPKTLEFYETFFQNGVEPWIARSDDRIWGVVWLYSGSYLFPWEGYDAWLLRIEVEPTAKFVANVFVDPARRGRGVFPIIADHCFDAYPESEFYSAIDELNVTSIRSHEKIGFRRCGAVYFVRIFRRPRCIFRSKRGKSCSFRMSRGVAAEVVLARRSPING